MGTWDRPAVTPVRKMAASRLWAAFAGVALASGLALASAVRWRNFSGGQSLLPALQAANGAAVATQHSTKPWERPLSPASPPSTRQVPGQPSSSAPVNGQTSKAASQGGPAKSPASAEGQQAADDAPADPSAMEEPIGWLNASPAQADASEEWGDVPPPQSGSPGWLDSTESAEDDARAEEQPYAEVPPAGAKSRLGAAEGKASGRGEAPAGADDGCPRIPANSPAAVAVLRATAAAQSAAADAANAAAQAATAAADASAAAARVEAGGGDSRGFSTGDGDEATMPFYELDTNIVITATRMATHAAAVARDAAKAAASAASAAVAASGPCRGAGPSGI
jgi:hypothetical protein